MQAISIKAFGPLGRRMKVVNIVGPRVRRFRSAKLWSQNVLATKLQLAGLDKSREAVARIESQIVRVYEYELLYIAKVLGVGLLDLFPEIHANGKLHEAVTELMKPRKSNTHNHRRRKTSRAKKTASPPRNRPECQVAT